MKVKLTYFDTFENDFNGTHYKIYQFANPLTFDIINGVNLETNTKLIPYDVYLCVIERYGKKWRVTKVDKLD